MDLAEQLRTSLRTRYELGGEIGRGGAGIVYRARDLLREREVAIKVLRPEITSSVHADRFLREIQFAAQLQHPHILPVFDSGEVEGTPYYVMPYVEQESLRARLRRERALDIDEATRISDEIADALSYAHRRGVVHRDIKPENILLSDGHALVADFGCALGIEHAQPALTESGVAIGTPAYMSPEQATASPHIDGRSDIYSLACVLFEMLSGEPPFTGPTAQAVVARQVNERPPSLSIVRPAVSAELQATVERALAKVPADRYRTAEGFRTALASREVRAVRPPRPKPKRIRWLVTPTAVALAAAIWGLTQWTRSPALDPFLFAVLEFDTRDGVAPGLIDGSYSQWQMSAELRQWREVSVVEHAALAHVVRRGSGRGGLDAALAAARTLGVGRLVHGEVARFVDSTVEIQAAVRDVSRGGRIIAEARATVSPNLVDVTDAFRRIATELLGLSSEARRDQPFSTRSIEAVRAVQAGKGALFDEGEVFDAIPFFSRALEADPDFVDGHFWLAQVSAWAGLPPQRWRANAQLAADRSSALPAAERAVAGPLLALANELFPQACEGFEAAIAGDSSNASAWVGLAECRFRDSTVIADAASPSGFRFRSSYHAAVDAYEEALARARFLTPALYRRLARIIRTESYWLRIGRGAPPDTTSYQAYPALQADTLVFIPYPAAAIRAVEPGSIPPSLERAVQRGREILQGLIDDWGADYPRSFEARYRLAVALEWAGQIDRGADGVTALSTLDLARQLAQTIEDSLRAAAARVRLLVKVERFGDAVDLVDSLTRQVSEPPTSYAEPLAGLTALGGMIHRTANLIERNAPDMQTRGHPWMRALPLPVLEVRERMRAYAAWDETVDSVRALERVLEGLLESQISSSQRTRIRQQLLDDVHAQTYFALGIRPAHRPNAPNDMLIVQQHLERGDTAAVRRHFRERDRQLEGLAQGQILLDRVLLEARIRLAMGDTAAATAELDRSLGALGTSRTDMLREISAAAAHGQAMALRAQLAAADGDAETAAQWARRVLALWRHADRELEPVIDHMRRLVGPPGQ